MGTAIEIVAARKTYSAGLGRSKRGAVHDVSITVEQGTVHGLLGPNGAGKTTTVKMLLGLVAADGGEFRILDADPRIAANRSAVGFLPEQPYYPAHGSARRVLSRYARLSGVTSPVAERVDDRLESVGLALHSDVPLSKYSRGMLQRFGIAQALVGDPEVVILDEPASGLDPVGQRDVRNLILDLRSSGVTVLLSSHQLSEVEAVCDEVTIVNAGRVAARGALDDLLSVRGRTSIRVGGMTDLPADVQGLIDDVALANGHWVFSVPDDAVRRVVDSVDDAGGRLVSIAPKRDSLEDYFDRMLSRPVDDSGEVVTDA